MMKQNRVSTLQGHEFEFVRTFVCAGRRDRVQNFLSSEKKRKKFLESLGHFSDFEDRYVFEIESRDQNAARIMDILLVLGAPEMCHVTSENPKIDSKYMMLSAALENTIGLGFGTIISCLAGKLAFYEGEYHRRMILKNI